LAQQDATDVYPGRSSYYWFRSFQKFLLAHKPFAQLATMLGGEQALTMPPAELYMRHTRAVAFLHQSLSDPLRLSFAKVVGAFVKDCLPDAEVQSGETDSATLENLTQRGYAFLPSLEQEKLALLQDWFREQPLVTSDVVHESNGSVETSTADVLRTTHNLAQVPRSAILAMPGLPDLVTDPAILNVVRDYLCAPPILIDASAWQSFCDPEGAKQAQDAQLFHYDQDDYRFCKVFIYLNDVDRNGGPHVYIPESHRPDVIATRRPPEGDPKRDAFDQWYFKTLRKSDADSISWLGREPDYVTGPAGSVFVANTEGIHRGEPPSRHDRAVIQLVFGITPFSMWEGPYAQPSLRSWDGSTITLDDAPARYALHMLATSGWPEN